MALSKKDLKQRMNFVRLWVNYMKKTPNKVWSRQQAILVNSILKSANQNAELYMKVKGIAARKAL